MLTGLQNPIYKGNIYIYYFLSSNRDQQIQIQKTISHQITKVVGRYLPGTYLPMIRYITNIAQKYKIKSCIGSRGCKMVDSIEPCDIVRYRRVRT